MTAVLSKTETIDPIGVAEVEKWFTELTAELTAPAPLKKWQVPAPVAVAVKPDSKWCCKCGHGCANEIDTFINLAVTSLPSRNAERVSEEECAEYADAAADAVERYGWRQGGYGGPQIGMCAMGALAHVTMTAPMDRFRASHVFAMVSYRVCENEGIGYLPNWNDSPQRIKADVIAAFREAAESFRAGT